jgi:site-specific DNA-cytosine methylase
MSFKDDFVFPADQKWTEVAKQIGNGVPPLLARAIADALASTLDLAQDAPPEERAA